MSTKSHRSGNAFTLIELLVVIAIISILASILFPVFARARENARRTSCLSNMKQIGLGMMQYVQDYDERFPLAMWEGSATFGIGTGGAGSRTYQRQSPLQASTPAGKFRVSAGTDTQHYYSWMDFIFPYVKSTNIFECASFDPSLEPGAPSYGYNPYLSKIRPYPSQIPSSQADIGRSAEIIMALELPTYHSTYSGPDAYCQSASTSGFMHPSNSRYYLMWPHFEGGTVAFADGHAKWYKRGASAVCRVNGAANTQRAWDPTLP